MTEPTLTKLREMATRSLAWLDGLSDETREVLRAFPVLAGKLEAVTAERDELRRELEELRDRIQDAEMEAREEPCST